MIEQAAKIAIGTAFYVAVLWLAQRNPRATGIMLTFPTLNGIVLLMAEPVALPDVAAAMLLMPPFNGVLWATYLTGFAYLAAGRLAPRIASGLLTGAAAAAWSAFAIAIAHQDWHVPAHQQWAYWAGTTALGLLLTLLARPRTPPAILDGQPQALRALLAGNRTRIALFVVVLAAIALADRLGGSPALLGALAGMPLIALFGLHSIASDGTRSLAARRDTMAAMAVGVWLGPGIAILFVAVLWRLLSALAMQTSSAAYVMAGAALLLTGWALSIAAIWALACLLQRVLPSPERTP